MGQTDPLTAQRQIMLSLAYLAYAGELLPPFPSPDAQIEVLVDDGLTDTTQYPTIANEWTRVWGPVTWTVPGHEVEPRGPNGRRNGPLSDSITPRSA